MDLSQALQIASRSDAGMVRSHNEDAVFVSPRHGFALLADGMGGYSAGEVAAGMATGLIGEGLARDLPEQELHRVDASGRLVAHAVLDNAIARANSAIYEAAQSQPQYAGMGTTLVAALFFDNALTVAHIGDSRLYRLRGREFVPLTRDHSLLQEQIESGMITPAEARRSCHKNLVTRAMGVEPVVDPEIRDYDTRPGDVYLLCSDGLNDMVDDEELGLALARLVPDLDAAAAELVRMANDAGGRDNVSVVLVQVLKEYPGARNLLSRFRFWKR